ncbi:hypothetical protein AB0K86_06125 [Streptomyces clavifer]|uniref:hypothetical protein n=1 Tax=Streptomyces TaxID=1883 RepID=UPI0012FEEF57|nr:MULTISPECIES: hypothetical protein [unclassified Streptomyces]
MARANITTVAVGRDSLEPAGTPLAVADGGAFTPTGREVLKLTSSGAATVTIPTNAVPHDTDGDGNPEPIVRTLTFTAGQTRYARFEGTSFAQPDGTIHVNVSAVGVSALVLLPGHVDVGTTP